jgi:RNA polymerase sigma-70 factor (ECF subfamily)
MDVAQFSKHLLAQAPGLRQYIRRHLPPELARSVSPDDVLQDVWMRAQVYVRDVGLGGIESAESWLTKLASNTLVDHLRAQRALKRGGTRQHVYDADLRASYINLFQRLASPRNTPSSEIAMEEAARLMKMALDTIPEDQSRAIRLRHLDGLSYKEISTCMARTVPAVHGLLARGLVSLRFQLQSASRFFSDATSTAFTHDPPLVSREGV